MNIFFLDRCPQKAARMHIDKHVVKMIVEAAQMLSMTHSVLSGAVVGYKATHRNHPMTRWAGTSTGNYKWVYGYMASLGREYRRRYRKTHAVIREYSEKLKRPPKELKKRKRTEPPQCMPAVYRQQDVVAAYRAYYKKEKLVLVSKKESDRSKRYTEKIRMGA
ncbi:MAG: uncharacterized protein A8A55_2163 [Amphiamblys sp. WSBS2006]|nr:MAG: uncharacterized protein A8A55_2163 [Amphiamblys sp. WSBS2006]